MCEYDKRDEIVIDIGKKPRLSKEEQANASRQELFDSAQRYAMGVVGDILAKIHNFSRDERNLVIQEGLLGLWIATDKFDPTKGASLATYAHMQIYYRASRQVMLIFRHKNAVQGLEDSLYPDQSIMRGRDKEALKIAEEKDYISYLIGNAGLNDAEKEYITMYYGIGDDPPMLLHEVGDKVGVSKQRVKQVLNDGLKKMKKVIQREDKIL
jgi:RNA polymerase sigma factor (sigma-70 family)